MNVVQETVKEPVMITAASQKYKKRSQWAEIWRRLKKNKGAMVGLAIVCILIFIALFADFLVDYDTDVTGQQIMERLQWPSAEHIMGTDEMGRDLFARVLYGTRISLAVGLVAVTVALIFGVTLGAIAGYYGGALEDVIMRVTDIFAAVPNILMGIVIVAAMGASTINLMIAVGVTSIPMFVRVTRAAVLTVRNQEYVEAARAVGMGEMRIIFSHVLPNCLSPIVVQTTLRVASAIISASSLSFLGLGVPVPSPEWGALLSAGRQFLRTNSYLTFFPGLAILITVLALNMLGDGLRDALDPKLRK